MTKLLDTKEGIKIVLRELGAIFVIAIVVGAGLRLGWWLLSW